MEIDTQEINLEYCNLFYRLGPAFVSDPGFKNAQMYMQGLLGDAQRKNGWQLAEYLGETTPYAMQQFISRGVYDADKLRDIERTYIADNLGDEDGVMVVDETGFIKKGKKSCGVARQYSGTAGRVENCQIGVFLNYASKKGHCPIDRRLYMPEEWTTDSKRLWGAGVPEWVEFKTKPQLALRMIKEATEAGVPYRWVTGDSVYGNTRFLRDWLERKQKSYVLCVSRSEYIKADGLYASVGDILDSLPLEGWFEASCGDGTKGARVYDWYLKEIAPPWEEGFRRWLLVRRSQVDRNDLRAHICFAMAGTSKIKLIEVAGTRWTVEMGFEEGKQEVGMDEYEFRSYEGWYRHVTFACIALAFLTVLSSKSMDKKNYQDYDPSGSDLASFKKAAQSARLSKGDLRKIVSHWFSLFGRTAKKTMRHIMNWIEWRRLHQSVAMWFHYHACA